MPLPDDPDIDSALALLDPDTEVRNVGVRDFVSPTEAFTNNNTATRVVRVPWEKRALYVAYYAGYNGLKTESLVQRLKRRLPRQYPGFPEWFCTGCSNIKGFGPPDADLFDVVNDDAQERFTVYTHADLTLEYEQVDYAVIPDADTDVEYEGTRFTSIGEIKPQAEFLQVPGGMLKYTTEDESSPHGTPIPFGAGKILPLEEFRYVWHRVPYSIFSPGAPLYERIYGNGDDIKPYLGTVNIASFAGRPPGTVMFTNVNPIRQRSRIGAGWEWDLEYIFTYDPNRWNWKLFVAPDGGGTFHYVSKSGTFYDVGDVPDDDSLYNERDLDNLWNPFELP